MRIAWLCHRPARVRSTRRELLRAVPLARESDSHPARTRDTTRVSPGASVRTVRECLAAPRPMGGTMTTATTNAAVEREPQLLGQTVVVIGGSAGIGLETARLASREGADIVLSGRNPDRLKQAASDVSARSSAAFDADDPAGVKRFFGELDAPIDHVLVAAYTRRSHGPMLEIPSEEVGRG